MLHLRGLTAMPGAFGGLVPHPVPGQTVTFNPNQRRCKKCHKRFTTQRPGQQFCWQPCQSQAYKAEGAGKNSEGK